MSENPGPNIVIVDYISEKNRGDAAIHLGLINLIRRSYPDAILSGVSIFGANQFPEMEGQFDQTKNQDIKIYGGLVPTFYPTTASKHKPSLVFEIQNLVSLFIRLWLLVALKVHVPIRFVNRCISAKYQRTLSLIKNADLLVIRGRNYRDRKTAILEFVRILSKIYHLLLCSLLSKKIVLVGASVWDQKSNLADKLLGNAFTACQFVTVRENWSFIAAKRMALTHNFPEPLLIPDLSFAAFEDRKTILRNRAEISRDPVPSVIGLTVHDWRTEGNKIRDRYMKSIAGMVQHYTKRGTRIMIIPQVSVAWEDSSSMIEDLLKKKAENVTVIKGDPSVQELLHLYSNLDLLVATRMHSAIFAAAVNTPVVAIPYDKGGKWGIIEELGYGDYLINYGEITAQILIDKICNCWQNKETLAKNAEKIVDNNTENLQLLVDLFKAINIRHGFHSSQ